MKTTGTRLPEKGATTGSIIGAIIGVIILLAIIGTAIAMYRKHRGKINGDGPPKYKPPPPNKNNSTANREMTIIRQEPPAETRPLQNDFTRIQNTEPVTDLDAHYDDEDVDESREHYYSAAPSGWDDPGNAEVPPPYKQTGGEEDYRPNVNRAESFISPAMFV
uniref:Uncharacterized protein n=1 Tax=Knipowitschia caucasica TaxID=637954 RepID=A0AAV2MC33_KNICA